MSLFGRLLERLLTGPEVVLPTDPIPDGWAGIFARRIPLSMLLGAPERTRLSRLTQLFLRDVPMEGCGGLELTEEIVVTIAGTASLLLLNLPFPRFPGLRRVLVYPDTFIPVRVQSYQSQAIPDVPVPHLGEAWRNGTVVLSWSDVLAGGAHAGDGRNVVLHEFAHVLDFEDGVSNGSPVLASANARATWKRIVDREFTRLHAAAERGLDTDLDPYGATNRAEFFAVATEAFFETGRHLRDRLPELYEQLRLFYQQDPAEREAP